MGPYFHCKKMGHLIANCPSLQATTSKNVYKKKKVMIATWNDSEMDFFGFIGNLKTHKIEMKMREERETSKKKAIAFKATHSTIDEKDSSKDGDEDFAMLIRKVGKIFYKKERQSNFRREKYQGRFEKKEEEMVLTFIARRWAI